MRDPLRLALQYIDSQHIGYKLKSPPDIKNHIFIDDIDKCIWFRRVEPEGGGHNIAVYPYEGFTYITWKPDE